MKDGLRLIVRCVAGRHESRAEPFRGGFQESVTRLTGGRLEPLAATTMKVVWRGPARDKLQALLPAKFLDEVFVGVGVRASKAVVVVSDDDPFFR